MVLLRLTLKVNLETHLEEPFTHKPSLQTYKHVTCFKLCWISVEYKLSENSKHSSLHYTHHSKLTALLFNLGNTAVLMPHSFTDELHRDHV